MAVTHQTKTVNSAKNEGKKPPMRWMELPVVRYPVMVMPDGQKHVLWDGIGTKEAAKLMGLAQRTVQTMCDEGAWKEIAEFRRTFSIGGRGQYLIKREAIMELLSQRKQRSDRKLRP